MCIRCFSEIPAALKTVEERFRHVGDEDVVLFARHLEEEYSLKYDKAKTSIRRRDDAIRFLAMMHHQTNMAREVYLEHQKAMKDTLSGAFSDLESFIEMLKRSGKSPAAA